MWSRQWARRRDEESPSQAARFLFGTTNGRSGRFLPNFSTTFDITTPTPLRPQLARPQPIASTMASMGNSTALRAFRTICASCRTSISSATARPFSQARVLAAAPKAPSLEDFNKSFDNIHKDFSRTGSLGSVIPSQADGLNRGLVQDEWEEDKRHHLHIYSTKHNTHITLTDPSRNPMVSVSCGNIGFRKANRGSYDAAYQLAAFVMLRIKDMGWLPKIQEIELVYRGFGQGREAVTKAILGSEGKDIRPLIQKLSDATRLKFGGTRSKKPRRLG